MQEESTIGIDVECESCGYNLRGLSPHGSCPECGASIVSSLSSREEGRLRRFRLVKPRFLRVLLVVHLLVGISYLAVFIVPSFVQGGPWPFFHKTGTLATVSRRLIFPGLPLTTAFAFTVLILAVANRNRLANRRLRYFVLGSLAGFIPTAFVLEYSLSEAVRYILMFFSF